MVKSKKDDILPGADDLVAPDNSDKAIENTEEVFDEKQYNKTHPQEKVKTPHLSPKPKFNLPHIIISVLVCILLAGIGLLAGVMLGDRQNIKNNNPSGSINDGPQEVIISESGELIAKTALIPEDDKITLSFLKLHNDKENSCYSPLSMRYALEMLKAATGGETRAQIENLLGDVVVKKYDNVADHLAVANSFWVDTNLRDKIKTSFINNLRSQFGAEIETDDFRSAENMNKWIEENSLGLLKNALADSDVVTLEAALVNVLAIDMNWEVEFDKVSTTGLPFAGRDGEYDATTMQVYANSRHLYYNFADNATVFATNLKQYGGHRLQFVAIQPKDLENFIANAEVTDVNKLLAGLKVAMPANDTYRLNFSAYMPKFKIEDGGLQDAIGDLKTLGVNDVFELDKADFSNMTDTNGFFIDGIKQKTMFELSEEGIRAAAATIVGGRGAGGPPHNLINITVVINGPFMYLVRDIDSGDVWFAGTIYHPNEWSESESMTIGG